MDRNEKFRRGLERKLNQPIKKELSARASNFDPTPYVNILMDNIHWDDEEELEDSIDDINTNPDLDFILGRTSLLSFAQKQMVIKELQNRLAAIFEFDPIPYANELLEIWGTSDFEQYQFIDEDGDVEYDFSDFFDQHHFTKEQKAMVSDCFFEQIGHDDEDDLSTHNTNLIGKERIEKVYYIIPIILVLIFVVTPSLFIPNYLQRIGWLSPEAGWFMKIVVGIMSGIAILFIWRKLISWFFKRVLKINDSK